MLKPINIYPIIEPPINIKSEVDLLEQFSASTRKQNDIRIGIRIGVENSIGKNMRIMNHNANLMPKCNEAAEIYQKKYDIYNSDIPLHEQKLDALFSNIQYFIPEGQKLLHYGTLDENLLKGINTTTRYLSTSIDLIDAVNGASYQKQPNMYILTIKSDKIKAYYYDGQEYELEILLQKNIKLEKKGETILGNIENPSPYYKIIEVDVFL